MDAALKVGARSLTIHSNGLGEGGRVISSYPELSDTVKLCAMFDTLRACAELAEASGIQMNLEPLNTTTDHAGNFLTTTRTAAELTRLIGSPRLKVLYDVYHMQLNEGEPVRQHPGPMATSSATSTWRTPPGPPRARHRRDPLFRRAPLPGGDRLRRTHRL